MSLASAPLEEGLAFDTGPEGVYAVQDYALAQHKSVRVERASGADRRLVCSSEAPCVFFVQIYRQRMSDKKTYGKWYIASLELAHSEVCDSIRRLTTRQIAELPAFMEAVQANPKASIESLMTLVLERYGVALDKQIRLVYRARDAVRNGKAVMRNNILLSEDAPVPERQFVRRHVRDKKPLSEPNKLMKPERMTWTDVLIESLLIERIVKYGKQFVEDGEQSQHRELWVIIHREFKSMHKATVTVTQLRAKFRYLHEQYLKVRAEEDEAAQDSNKSVIYPRCWDMLVEYFGDDFPHEGSPGIGVDHKEANGSQALNMADQLNYRPPAQSIPFVPQAAHAHGQAPKIQPDSVSVYSAPVEIVPQAQVEAVRQAPSPVHSDAAAKRRRINVLAVQQDLRPAASSAPSDSASEVALRLEAIESVQSEMARSMDGMKQVVEQSNEAIRGLQQALNQSNQVNAALLDFLRRPPSA